MNLASLSKQITELKESLPKEPSPEALEARRWLAGLTPAEIDRAGAILIDADNGQEPTEGDIAFHQEIAAREPVDLPAIDPRQPVCVICRGQPAYPRDGSLPLCQGCYDDEL